MIAGQPSSLVYVAVRCRGCPPSADVRAAASRRARCAPQHGRGLEAELLGHVLDLRQVAQVLQAELVEELASSCHRERPADDVLAPHDLHQLPLEERGEHAGGVDAADLPISACGDRLFVGDHRSVSSAAPRASARSARGTAAGPIRAARAASRSGSRRRPRRAAGRPALVVLLEHRLRRGGLFLRLAVEQLDASSSVNGSGERRSAPRGSA